MQRSKVNDFLFVFYIFLFPLSKIITTNFEGISTFILLTATLLILGISIFENRGELKIITILILFFSILISLIEILVRKNDLTYSYIYQYTIYGLITMYLYSFTREKKDILYFYAYFSVLVISFLILDPFFYYKMTETYMVFGFSMLPAFVGTYIGRKFLKIKWMMIFEIVSFVSIVFFANRGALLTAIFIIVLFKLFNTSVEIKTTTYRKNIRNILSTFTLIILGTILALNAYPIVNFLFKLAESRGYFSYSLYTLNRALENNDFSSEFDSRSAIHEDAYAFIEEHPIFGGGIGAFHNTNGIYTHNLILDILTTFGFAGLLGFTIVILRSITKIFKVKSYDQIFYILFCCLAIIPLWFSINMFASKEFWIMFLIAFEPISRKYNLGKNS